MHTSIIRRVAGAFATAFVAAALAACGGDYYSAPQVAPTIASFSATPSTVPAGGSQVQLSWSTAGASQIVIDNGVGDVSDSTTKTISVTAGATYTLTASNAIGTVTASTVVNVSAAAAPTITTFIATPATLPAGGGSVTLSWSSTGAPTLSIDHGVGDVSGLTSKAVNVAANTTFALTATNAVGTVTKTTAILIASAADRFVDGVNGADANPCTLAAPCKSITKALTGAPAGSTLSLADGTYSTASESANVVGLPDGGTIRANNPGAVTIAGLQVFLHGSGTLDGVVMGREGPAGTNTCASVSAPGSTTATKTLTLIGVFSNCPNWLGLGLNVKATMTPGSLPGGVYTTGLPANATIWVSVFPSAELLIQGGVLEGNHTGTAYPQAGLLNVASTATLTLDGVTVRNWPEAALHTTGTAILQNGTVIDHVGASGDPGPLSSGLNLCDTNSAILVGGPTGGVLKMDHATLSNVASAGICVLSNFDAQNAQSVQIVQSSITDVVGAAIEGQVDVSTGSTNLGPTIALDGAMFNRVGRAIFWAGRPGTSFVVANTTITGSTGAANTGGSGIDTCLGGAVHFDMQTQPGSFKMRSSTVSSNVAEGVCVMGQASVAADLGTAADPGGNAFTGNGLAGLRVDPSGVALTVNAVGNLWTPSQQGADASGRYSVPPSFTPVPKTGPVSGANFTIDNASGALNL